MKREGWLVEIESPADRRQRVVGLSARGNALWKRTRKAYERGLRALDAELGAGERAVCSEALRRIARRAARLPAER